jgi:hypothetical protein
VSQLTSRLWANGLAQLQQTENANELLLNGKAPNAGGYLVTGYQTYSNYALC